MHVGVGRFCIRRKFGTSERLLVAPRPSGVSVAATTENIEGFGFPFETSTKQRLAAEKVQDAVNITVNTEVVKDLYGMQFILGRALQTQASASVPKGFSGSIVNNSSSYELANADLTEDQAVAIEFNNPTTGLAIPGVQLSPAASSTPSAIGEFIVEAGKIVTVAALENAFCKMLYNHTYTSIEALGGDTSFVDFYDQAELFYVARLAGGQLYNVWAKKLSNTGGFDFANDGTLQAIDTEIAAETPDDWTYPLKMFRVVTP